MLRVLSDLERYTVSAMDGEVGSVIDLLFDDEHWTIRYLVAETGGFFVQRQVLISPVSFRQVEWSMRQFHVQLSLENVKNSPSVDVHAPVSRQQERAHAKHYGYTNYWGRGGLWGVGSHPSLLAGTAEAPGDDALPERLDETDDAHLRSAREVRGYELRGNDEMVGNVDDFIIDDQTWQVRYLVITTSDHWFAKQVLIAPQWTSSISWEKKTAFVDISREAIQRCPEWNANAAINREYEKRLYDYYGRPVLPGSASL
jgi:sporulation protein YlmC with PRC-barrel domain